MKFVELGLASVETKGLSHVVTQEDIDPLKKRDAQGNPTFYKPGTNPEFSTT